MNPPTLHCDYAALKALVPLAAPAIKATIDGWLAPAIGKLKASKELAHSTKPENVSQAFEEYLLRTYARLSFMNTIVFGNQQKRIQDLYIPLTLQTNHPTDSAFKIDQWRSDFVPAYKRVIVTDTAGMGKSTILKWLFLCSLGTSQGIPIFIELRSLSAEKTLLDKIHEELCPIDQTFDKALLLQLLKNGSFIIFLDGFDEVAYEDRRAVTEDIQSFIRKTFNNYFVLASRHETALSSFGEFKEFTIKPLTKEEAYTLLRRYDESQDYSEPLISELEGGKYEQLKDLMVNPMLVSLLFKAYSYKPNVPFKKQIFYRQVYDALFDMHDSTKGGAFVRKKHSNLDIDEFHNVMRELGFITAKIGKIEYGKDEISDHIKKVRERNKSILFQPSALLIDLVTTVPLFNKEGEQFKWAHKSVQDYFASQFIALDTKGNESALLEKIYNGGHCRRFENILDMLHDTDNNSFRRVLLARLLKDYVYHYDNTYQMKFEKVSLEAIEKRKQLTFGYNFAIKAVPAKRLPSLWETMLQEMQTAFSDVFSESSTPIGFMMIPGARTALLQGVMPKPAYGLLPLLAAKKYPYISKAYWTEIPMPKALKFDVHLVTDDPDSPLNSFRNFEAVNSLLTQHGFLISIEQVRRTLKSIESETTDSTQVDQLLQNL